LIPLNSNKCFKDAPINGLEIAKHIIINVNKYCPPIKYIKIITENSKSDIIEFFVWKIKEKNAAMTIIACLNQYEI
jgi:hypothetical protein